MATIGKEDKEFSFLWEGRDKAGKQMKGEIRAKGEAMAQATLRRQGIIVSKIQKQRLARQKQLLQSVPRGIQA